MSLRFNVDLVRRLILLTGEGVPTPADWQIALDLVAADPHFSPGFDVVYDRTRVVSNPDPSLVRQWVSQCAKDLRRVGAGRVAVVVAEPVAYGMMRMASVFAEGSGVVLAAFRSEREALEWLGR